MKFFHCNIHGLLTKKYLQLEKIVFGGQIGDKRKKVHKEYQITKKSFIFPGWHTDLGMYLEKAMRMSRLLPESD